MDKELEEFSLHSKGKFGRHPWCIECRNKDARERYARTGRSTPYTYKAQLRRYGMTLEDYQKLLTKQDEKCAICKNEGKLVVDHDHTTGIVRGLLCSKCNTGLGKLGDNIEKIEEVLGYLRRVG